MVGVEGVNAPTAFARDRHLRLRQTKVHQLCARFGQHDVRRLQIAMDDALLMRLLQGLSDFCSNLQNLIERQRAFRQALGESLAFEILHDQEVGAVLRADVVKRADIRMLQRGNGFGLALHALLQFRVSGEMRRQNLDGDGAVEASVLGAIDLAHAACAERREDFVGTELWCRRLGPCVGRNYSVNRIRGSVDHRYASWDRR